MPLVAARREGESDAPRLVSGGLWAPEYDTVVGPGEAIVFPPSYLHETFVSPTDNPDGGCTVATTFQLSAPAPARFLRAFLPRLVSHASASDLG